VVGNRDRRHGDRIVVVFSWSDKAGGRHGWAQALRLKDGRIVDVRDYRSPTKAVAATRVRAVVG
jgi:hypothetical protein